ncbi:hypothetical protein FHS89_001477 [Rubricella aquisinus]|uniref:Mitochondrial inner membrane protein n=1 Tax=Rubricella aquisinus TaxID=2028108 RepID=A0A840X0P7_9RHOB|nr:hypothetical protein [Rubricella aquisinus]MBB5515465.1 hypothetical protein [Rubricella aquisinus]
MSDPKKPEDDEADLTPQEEVTPEGEDQHNLEDETPGEDAAAQPEDVSPDDIVDPFAPRSDIAVASDDTQPDDTAAEDVDDGTDPDQPLETAYDDVSGDETPQDEPENTLTDAEHDEKAEEAASGFDPAVVAAGAMAGVAITDRQDAEEVLEEVREEPHHDEYDDHHEEHERRSFAAQVLTFIVVFLAGGAFFIWAAPQVAPRLPQGMAPVAAWLTPGAAEMEERIAQLEIRITNEMESIEPGLSADAVDARISAALSDGLEQLRADLTAQIGQMSDQVAAADSGEIEARLATLETQASGLFGELNSLRTDLTGLESTAAELPEETAEQVAAFDAAMTAQVAGLRAELEALAGRQGNMSQRIDEVAASAARQIAEAEAQIAEAEAAAEAQVADAAVVAELNAVSAALAAGEAYSAPLDALSAQAEVPDGLARSAGAGVARLAGLQAQFGDLAHEAIRQSIIATAGDSPFARARAELRARTVGRSLVEIEGATPDAILSRMEARLNEGDLDAVLTEADALPEVARGVMEDWLVAVAARRDALAGFGALAAELGSEN